MDSATTAMTAVDAAWYYIDGPANLAQINGILLTREPLDFARVKELCRRRLLKFRRFRQRVVEATLPLMTPTWTDDPDFQIARHVLHRTLPRPADKATLMEILGELVSSPLDRSRPLWEVHVIDPVETGSALVMRFHHCIGDGTALMALALELFDVEPGASHRRQTIRPPQAGMLDRSIGSSNDIFSWSVRMVGSTLQTGLDLVLHPDQALEKTLTAVGGIGMLIGELLKSPDPPTPFKGKFGMKKRVAWSDPVPLADVKAIGKVCDAKVNDVLVAGMAGAVRKYLLRHGLDVERISQRAMVPVDLRPRDRALQLGNEFGLVVLDLPIQMSDPLERLRRAKENMDALKQSPEAVAVLGLFNVLGYLPKPVEDLAIDLFGSKASMVMTNVAGPRETLYVTGVPIERIMFWVPHPGGELGMGVSILSYNGEVSLAVVADAELVPDPETITRQFSLEFAAMRALCEPTAPAPQKVRKRRTPAIRLRPETRAQRRTAAPPPRRRKGTGTASG